MDYLHPPVPTILIYPSLPPDQPFPSPFLFPFFFPGRPVEDRSRREGEGYISVVARWAAGVY